MASVGLSPRRAHELLAKYREMLAMRLDHEAARRVQAEEDEDVVRARMGALARRFPGALREIDRLELAEIRTRIRKLEEAVAGDGEGELWMLAIALFHELMRGALCAKQWLDGARHVDDEARRAFTDAAAALEFPEDARAWIDRLGEVASPPGGRIAGLVYARIARELQTTPDQARRLVFEGAEGLPTDAKVSSTSR